MDFELTDEQKLVRESGSDVASMTTVARDMGGCWELTGSKIWVSNATQGDAGLL